MAIILNDNCQAAVIDKKEKIKKPFWLTFKDYKGEILSFCDNEKREYKNKDDELILKVYQDENNNFIATSGNYIGKFKINNHEVEIKSRFGDPFLFRMLNFANDIFLKDATIAMEKTKDVNVFEKVLHYLFIKGLEKVFLLGLPKDYVSVKHHDISLKGKVDIKRYLKNDIPFIGRISSISQEQIYNQDIIDVLFSALNKIKAKSEIDSVMNVYVELKMHKSNKAVAKATIAKALCAKALTNNLFAHYKKILEYAKYIIDVGSLKNNSNSLDNGCGYIINVAELFEIYVSKLLQNNFKEYTMMHSPKIELYKRLFFSRKIIPDIVLSKEDKVIVFDTKYKKMSMQCKNKYGAGDLDRDDFFQINTYMAYYHNKGLNVLIGGLLYPMDNFDSELCHSSTWLGNKKTKFIVDGIHLKDSNNEDSIILAEEEFVKRIKSFIEIY